MFRCLAQLVDDLLPVNTHVLRRCEAKSHLITTHMKHGDRNVTIDAQRLENLTSENEHIPISNGNQSIANTYIANTYIANTYIANMRFDLESVRKDMQWLNRQANLSKVHRGDFLIFFGRTKSRGGQS
jgi:hypothetical protein